MRYDIRVLRFDGKPFFTTIFCFSLHCDYKGDNEYFSEKNRNLNVIDKIHLKCDVIDGSIQNGLTQPILFSFNWDKPSGYKILFEPETVHYKKVIKPFWIL